MNNTIFQLLFWAVRSFHPAYAWLKGSELLAQSSLETDYFKSPICKENKNLFGMKHPAVRKTLSKGTNRGHASYDSYLDSIKDYFLWLEGLHITTRAGWERFLQTRAGADPKQLGYAEGPQYWMRLKQVESKLESQGAFLDFKTLGVGVVVGFFLSLNIFF